MGNFEFTKWGEPIRDTRDGKIVPEDANDPKFCEFLCEESAKEPSILSVPQWSRFYCEHTHDELINRLRDDGTMIHVENKEIRSFNRAGVTIGRQSVLQLPAAKSYGENASIRGFDKCRTNIFVSSQLLQLLNSELDSPKNSYIRRLSTWPIMRAFVYVDVSDFTRQFHEQQSLVIRHLTSLVSDSRRWSGREAYFETIEKCICIGDGYILCFKEAEDATIVAAGIAIRIEHAVSGGNLSVPYHFRIGVHYGPVYQFWDGGMNWNYVGDGINGGARVIESIGKNSDDIVFISDAVRSELLKSRTSLFDEALRNRGRRSDKHGKMQRVYELEHTSLRKHL